MNIAFMTTIYNLSLYMVFEGPILKRKNFSVNQEYELRLKRIGCDNIDKNFNWLIY